MTKRRSSHRTLVPSLIDKLKSWRSSDGPQQGVSLGARGLSVAPTSQHLSFLLRSGTPGQGSAGHLSSRATTVSVRSYLGDRPNRSALDGQPSSILFRAVPPCAYGSSAHSRFLHPLRKIAPCNFAES